MEYDVTFLSCEGDLPSGEADRLTRFLNTLDGLGEELVHQQRLAVGWLITTRKASPARDTPITRRGYQAMVEAGLLRPTPAGGLRLDEVEVSPDVQEPGAPEQNADPRDLLAERRTLLTDGSPLSNRAYKACMALEKAGLAVPMPPMPFSVDDYSHRGYLLGVARFAYEDPALHVIPERNASSPVWQVWIRKVGTDGVAFYGQVYTGEGDDAVAVEGDSEAEAIVCALEAKVREVEGP